MKGSAPGSKRPQASKAAGGSTKKYSSSATKPHAAAGTSKYNPQKTGQPKQGNASAHSGKRPNTSGADQLHKKLRETAEQNRDARNELVLRMNKIWNELRSSDIAPEKQQALCMELSNALRGKVYSFAQRPDTSRVLQTLFKLAGDGQVRMMILDELQGHVVELCKGKYSSFLILSLLRNAKEDKERSKLAVEIRSSVRMLGSHSHGARVVNYCLCAPDVISPMEKKRFYEHLYGSTIMANSVMDLASTSYSLSDYFKIDNDDTKKNNQLQPLKKLLLKICEKGLLRFPFAQVLLWELLQNLSAREDVLQFLPVVTEASMVIVGTWEGAQCVAKVLRASDSKERKKIVKEWKSHVLDLCTHQFGWYVVAVFLCEMDDTKFSAKAIFGELFDDNNDQQQVRDMLAQDEGFGRKVLLQVILGSPQLVLEKPLEGQGLVCTVCSAKNVDDEHVAQMHAGQFVQQHAQAKRLHAYFENYDQLFPKRDAVSTSKKDANVRNQELFDELKKDLYKLLGESEVEQVAELLQNRRSTDLIRELFAREAMGENESRALALERVAEAATGLLDDAKAHLTVKRMIKDETMAMLEGSNKPTSSFASVFATKINPKELLKPTAGNKLNRVCFVLDALAEHPHTAKQMLKDLKPLVSKLPDSQGVQALKARLK
ncbi:hypothetical protein BASA81_001856 [Batrachochytrium salamandrivorans]|nr:hypothetical protein BASA81_001856 [Batrachochytrium salamandrivorans]